MTIKDARKAKNMTQKELSVIVGVDPGMISRYENGQVSPSDEILRRSASALNVTADVLIEEKYSDDVTSPVHREVYREKVTEILFRQFNSIGLAEFCLCRNMKPSFDYICREGEKTWLLETALYGNERSAAQLISKKFFSLVGKTAFVPEVNKVSIITNLPCERVLDMIPVSPRDNRLSYDFSLLHVNMETGWIDQEIELSAFYDGAGFYDLAVPGREAESAKRLATWKTSLSGR